MDSEIYAVAIAYLILEVNINGWVVVAVEL